MHNLKPRITQKEYALQQIQKYLDETVVYEAQIKVITKTLIDDEKKENAMKALSALNMQVKACNEQLKAWEEFYEELEKESTSI
jgi:intracellular sulfur oxidation DsrE/DsrF family protein